MDLRSVDELLTTTRAVRRRFDLGRPVDPALVEECLTIALQAPSGSAAQGWHFLVVTDPALRRSIGDAYREAFEGVYEARRVAYPADDPRSKVVPRVMESAMYLAQHMHQVPVHVIPCLRTRVDGVSLVAQAAAWGSILPAAWSFMLAARSRGLGTVWTTVHLRFADRVQSLLGIPDDYIQAALIPVGHYRGDSFKPASRLPLAQVSSWNRWGSRRA